MALPLGIPTLMHKSSKGEYWPDNLFLSSSLQGNLVSCATNRSLTPTGADHYLIQTILDFSIGTSTLLLTWNFRNINWEEFCKELRQQLILYGTPHHIRTQDDFNSQAVRLHTALAKTIENQVPISNPSQHMKCWWTTELLAQRKALRTLSNTTHKYRYV
ncbi:hypothetical protein NEOLEDRAFT_1019579, partial [Neolentinus lepideus HHB14362 ss-1]